MKNIVQQDSKEGNMKSKYEALPQDSGTGIAQSV